ncbi:MAG TPA: flagellar biosynthetic protein FliP, partial [Novosphingobium sp.]
MIRKLFTAASLFLLTAPVAAFAQVASGAAPGAAPIPGAPPASAAIPGALDRAFSSMNGGAPTGMTMSLQLLLIMGLLTILPSLILMMTSFTRILVVLSILRQAIGLQQSPPNQVL